MRVSVPSAVAHNKYEAFPEGFYTGEISEAKQVQSQDGSWRGVSISHGSVLPNEGTDDPGRNRYTATLTIERDGVNVLEVADFTDDSLPYGIRKSGALLAGLAEGLNIAEVANGQIDFDPEALVEALLEGTFEGERVSFEVTNWGENNENDQVEQYGPA